MKPKLEVVPHKFDSSIHVFYFDEDKFDAPWHYHNEFELTYITQSSGIRYIGNSIENFQPGDLILIGSLLPHAWKNASNYSNGSSSICVQWKAEELSDLFYKIAEFQSIKTLLDKANCGVVFKTSQQCHIIGNKLMALPAFQGAHRILSFLDILHELSTIDEIRLLSEPGDHILRYQETDNRIKDIFGYIDENFKRKITIDDMAELTYMTKSSFCKFFKKRFTKTFTQYLNEFRIHSVCQDLQDSSQSISQIAMDCGYDNMSYFHRQFKNIVGMTPARYRLNY